MMAQRSTFREKSAVCWQRQIRDMLNLDGVPRVPHLDVSRAMVRQITSEMARQIILKYEWLGTMGAGTQRCYGIFFGSFCAGVTCFASSGAIPAIPKLLDLPSRQVSYLTRGACVHWAPNGTNSRLIAKSCKLEKLAGVKIVAAFSDSDAGEIGTVYQASNWIYIGKAENGWPQYVSPHGKIWSSNSLTKRRSTYGGSCRDIELRLIKAGWTKQMSNPKGRYFYLIDRADRRLHALIESMRKPYPKRAASETIDTPPDQGGKGGEAPTAALQKGD